MKTASPLEKYHPNLKRNWLSRYVCMLSCFSRVRLFATLWTGARQALLSMGFSRQGYWSGLPFPPPEDLPTWGSDLHLLHLLALQVEFYKTWC